MSEPFRTRTDGGRTLVHDPVRRKWVALTPEEGVRQRLLADLLRLGYPVGLLAVERGVVFGGKTWRADVVAYGRDQRPLLLAECKAPGVRIVSGWSALWGWSGTAFHVQKRPQCGSMASQ